MLGIIIGVSGEGSEINSAWGCLYKSWGGPNTAPAEPESDESKYKKLKRWFHWWLSCL